MPKRTRFVRDEKVRLPLADVHRHLHQNLVTKGVLLPKKKGETEDKFRPATAEEIAESHARVEQAVEDGDWIDVKKQLTAGDTRDQYINLIKGGTFHQGEAPDLDPKMVGVNSILTYLLGWSFLDEGEPIAYSVLTMSDEERMHAILRLSPEDYQELDAAIDYHVAEMVAAKEEEKKRRVHIAAVTS